jgi:hypothetical protein
MFLISEVLVTGSDTKRWVDLTLMVSPSVFLGLLSQSESARVRGMSLIDCHLTNVVSERPGAITE